MKPGFDCSARWFCTVFQVKLPYPPQEMRFLQPLLPFVFYMAARYLGQHYAAARWARVGFVVSNLLLALYLSLVHQRGAVDLALWLGQQGNVNQANWLNKARQKYFIFSIRFFSLLVFFWGGGGGVRI